MSELAAYAYCPRSWWYDAHPSAEGRTVDSSNRSREGVRFHAATLSADRMRATWARAAAVVAVIAGLLLGGGAILGWWGW